MLFDYVMYQWCVGLEADTGRTVADFADEFANNAHCWREEAADWDQSNPMKIVDQVWKKLSLCQSVETEDPCCIWVSHCCRGSREIAVGAGRALHDASVLHNHQTELHEADWSELSRGTLLISRRICTPWEMFE